MVAQIYADKQVDGNWIGSRLNVYQKGMFYHNAEDKADTEHYIADDPAHGVLTLVGAGTIPGAGTGAGLMTVADKEKLDGINALTEEEILAILNN